jgi:hypothetical protein
VVGIFAGGLTPQPFPPTIHYESSTNVFVTFVKFDTPLFLTPAWQSKLSSRAEQSSGAAITIPKDANYKITWRLAYTNEPSFRAVRLLTMLYVNGEANYSTEDNGTNPPPGLVPPTGITWSAELPLKAGDQLSLGQIVVVDPIPQNDQNIGYIDNSIISIQQTDTPSCVLR